MKEKIYTIPINEAIEENSFCPFCSIYRRLENEAVEYTLGAAMMEPDFRMITNENGFCQKHIRDLHAESKALSLALVMDTHMEEINRLFEINMKDSKKSILKKGGSEKNSFVSGLKRILNSCAVCMRIEHTLNRYFETFVYMLRTEKDFLEKVLSIEGFCMEHFSKLAEVALTELSDKNFKELFLPVVELQKNRLKKYQTYIKNFADQFNYSNAGKKLDAPKDILYKTAELLNGEFESPMTSLTKIIRT